MIGGVLKMREWDLCPIREFARVLRRPWLEAALLIFFVGGMVQYGSTKGTNGADRGALTGLVRGSAPTVVPIAADLAESSLPANFPSITNLCFWGIERGDESISLGLAWPTDTSFTNGCVDVFGSHRLANNGWWRLAQVDVGQSGSNAVVELAYADFPTEDMRVSAFYRLASQDDFDGDGLSDKVEEWVLGTDPASSDTDNDGLSDGEEVGLKADPTSADSDSDGIDDGDEVGYLKVADSFVWYDTSELKPTYNTGYWHEELDTGISSWWCQATSGTCPDGAAIPIASSEFACLGAYSEIRLVRTCAQLVELGLLPPQDEDGVDEMAAYDVGTLAGADGSDLSDCHAFEQMALALRGRATNERTLTLDSRPPNAELSESFFKAAGAEVLSVTYGGVRSARRQIMNQADFFYYSGHGHHRWGTVDDFDPSAVAGYWMRDLDCVIFAGCSVLDINDYNDNFLNLEGVWDPADHAASPGKLWAAVGPKVLLGYNYYAPQDSSRAPERIMRSWLDLRQTMGDVDAWLKANDNRNGLTPARYNALMILTSDMDISKGKRASFIIRIFQQTS